MKILPAATEVILVQVLIGWWTSREVFLHRSNQLIQDFIHLITGKQTRYLNKHGYYFNPFSDLWICLSLSFGGVHL